MKEEKNLVGLPHPRKLPRPRMSRKQRAAQFAPFAALVGYEEMVAATEQQVQETVETEHRYTGDPTENQDEMRDGSHEVTGKLTIMTVEGSQKGNFRYNKSWIEKRITWKQRLGGVRMAGKGDSDFSYELVEELGVLSTSKKGWTKEINRVSYNGTKPKFDLREWAPEHEKMSKGITLSEEEAKDLCKILFQYFRNKG